LGLEQSQAGSAWSLPLIAEPVVAAAAAIVKGNTKFSHQYNVLQELTGLFILLQVIA
jgi:hypothetical protein